MIAPVNVTVYDVLSVGITKPIQRMTSLGKPYQVVKIHAMSRDGEAIELTLFSGDDKCIIVTNGLL